MPTISKKNKISWTAVKVPKRPQAIIKKIPLSNSVISACIINILVIIAIFLLRSHLPPQVPLYYGLARGEEQLADTLYLTLPSLMSSLILFINLIIALFIDDTFLKNTLVIAGFAAVLLSFITTTKIVLLVGSF